MNLSNYKKIAIRLLKNEDFKNAQTFFSLAYTKDKNKRTFIYIELCDLGMKRPQEASLLADFYINNYGLKGVDKDMQELLSKAYEEDVNHEHNLVFSYSDFLLAEAKVGFKQALTNIIFSTKMIISEQDEFLDFLNKLFDNGYYEMVLNYLDNLHPYFYYNHKFINLYDKIRAVNENRA